MKKVLLTISVVVALTLSSSTMAGDMRLSASLGGQMGSPMGDFGDVWESAIGGNGRIGLNVSSIVELGLNVSYGSFGSNIDALTDASFGAIQDVFDRLNIALDVSVEGGDLTILGVLSDARFFIPVGGEGAPFRPYLTAMGGFLNVSLDEMTASLEGDLPVVGSITFAATEPSKSEGVVTFGVGAGFEYMFSPTVGLWADAEYMLTNLKIQVHALSGTTLQEYVLEYTVAYLPIRAGVKFMFGG